MCIRHGLAFSPRPIKTSRRWAGVVMRVCLQLTLVSTCRRILRRVPVEASQLLHQTKQLGQSRLSQICTAVHATHATNELDLHAIVRHAESVEPLGIPWPHPRREFHATLVKVRRTSSVPHVRIIEDRVWAASSLCSLRFGGAVSSRFGGEMALDPLIADRQLTQLLTQLTRLADDWALLTGKHDKLLARQLQACVEVPLTREVLYPIGMRYCYLAVAAPRCDPGTLPLLGARRDARIRLELLLSGLPLEPLQLPLEGGCWEVLWPGMACQRELGALADELLLPHGVGVAKSAEEVISLAHALVAETKHEALQCGQLMFMMLNQMLEDKGGDPAAVKAIGAVKRTVQLKLLKPVVENLAAARQTGHGLGIAFSGGGVRAAAQAIGVLQGLCSTNAPFEVGDIDYVSSVSGGGYAAVGWLANLVWPTTTQEAIETVITHQEYNTQTKTTQTVFAPTHSPKKQPCHEHAASEADLLRQSVQDTLEHALAHQPYPTMRFFVSGICVVFVSVVYHVALLGGVIYLTLIQLLLVFRNQGIGEDADVASLMFFTVMWHAQEMYCLVCKRWTYYACNRRKIRTSAAVFLFCAGYMFLIEHLFRTGRTVAELPHVWLDVNLGILTLTFLIGLLGFDPNTPTATDNLLGARAFFHAANVGYKVMTMLFANLWIAYALYRLNPNQQWIDVNFSANIRVPFLAVVLLTSFIWVVVGNLLDYDSVVKISGPIQLVVHVVARWFGIHAVLMFLHLSIPIFKDFACEVKQSADGGQHFCEFPPCQARDTSLFSEKDVNLCLNALVATNVESCENTFGRECWRCAGWNSIPAALHEWQHRFIPVAVGCLGLLLLVMFRVEYVVAGLGILQEKYIDQAFLPPKRGDKDLLELQQVMTRRVLADHSPSEACGHSLSLEEQHRDLPAPPVLITNMTQHDFSTYAGNMQEDKARHLFEATPFAWGSQVTGYDSLGTHAGSSVGLKLKEAMALSGAATSASLGIFADSGSWIVEVLCCAVLCAMASLGVCCSWHSS
eukprot:TRINITY_DN5867_c0_g1_i9.p1 TRINITY_DN5867_c0_g1~~TRINITY_DN5867_c0_g1_i9.p1  ORF type:complete len:1046 (+),score=236.43 TRINITY_DN5867_c0_g1_i9:93-3140(+)